MTTITTITSGIVGDANTVTATTTLTILPAAGGSVGGRGRLVHPSLGTFDYAYQPDEWTNMDGDALILPVWSTTKTLRGAANTVFQGNLRDVIIEEHWNQPLSMPMAMLRTLLSFYMNPPDPSVAYIKWYPNYTNANGYNVVMLGLVCGQGASGDTNPSGVTLDVVSQQGWATKPVSLKMRIAGKL